MAAGSDLLHNGVVFLSAAVIAVPIAQKLGLGSVLGYLLAGVVIGPWGIGLIDDVEAVLHFAEFGVVLLLFLIGLELNPAKLWQMRRPILGLGGAQVVITTLVLAGLCNLSGISWQSSLTVGMGLALSSTAIALRVIEEQRLERTEAGQSGFAVLLFQDIAVIPMLALLPLLAGNGGGDWQSALWTLASMVGFLVGGHFLLRPLFRYVVLSGVRELFTIASLLLVIGIAVIMQKIGLSMALGTFLAGVLLAESEFQHELEIAIEPFKGLLLGLFFIAVGMEVDLGLLILEPVSILLAVAGLVLVKGLLLYLLARLFGTKAKARSKMAAILSQGGEFAFVLFTAAQGENLLQPELSSFLLVVVSLSMVTTPLILLVQNRWFSSTINASAQEEVASDIEDHNPRVIIAGFGRFGQVVGRLMYANKVNITVLESDPSQIQLLRKYGYQVFYGNATQLDLLRAAGADKAEAIVICTNNPDAVMEIVALCQQHFPHIRILARARSRVEAYQLLNSGVRNYSRETFSGALDLGRQLLVELGMHPYQAQRAADYFAHLDNSMLAELLSQHSSSNEPVLRAKEARKELEEIFNLEMESDHHSPGYWE
ncbi:glutathione-regulated potassium-efflux system protein KefB [Vibrio sp. HA2012]|uniref:glutathione-regulated potassium-efflux system protein KefB n=1 Tax=Vibrio sp. HA2012 TaxID=1971595 RepID=UPI000C2BA3A3|nr:glutathione-regulated potassium-efflux system protein KefB [Vibrio sp. HA2012]PJC85590.1 glutathione-regulated potassium-efflux system protein KefB [Vibrio sp. HA2012]